MNHLTKTITIKIKSNELEQIDKAAVKRGISRSAFMRECCFKTIEGPLADSNTIRSILQRLDHLDTHLLANDQLHHTHP